MSGDQGVEKELSADEASRPQRRHPQVAVAFVSVRMIKKGGERCYRTEGWWDTGEWGATDADTLAAKVSVARQN